MSQSRLDFERNCNKFLGFFFAKNKIKKDNLETESKNIEMINEAVMLEKVGKRSV